MGDRAAVLLVGDEVALPELGRARGIHAALVELGAAPERGLALVGDLRTSWPASALPIVVWGPTQASVALAYRSGATSAVVVGDAAGDPQRLARTTLYGAVMDEPARQDPRPGDGRATW